MIMINFPPESDMLLWYIAISILLIALFIGIGYAYFKILKKHWRRNSRQGKKPFRAVESLGK